MTLNATTQLFVSTGCTESLIAHYLAEVKGLEFTCLNIETNRSTAAELGIQRTPALSDRYVTLSDLDVIVEYLDEQHPAPCLLPANVADRAIYRTVVRSLHREIFPLLNKVLAGDAKAKEVLSEHLKQFNDTLQNRSYFAGDTFSLIDATFAPWLHITVSKGLSLNSLPYLKAYAERIFSSDAFRAFLGDVSA